MHDALNYYSGIQGPTFTPVIKFISSVLQGTKLHAPQHHLGFGT